MVYSTDIVTRTEALAAKMRLAVLLSINMKWEYSKMCGFVWARMSLEIDMSNSLLLCSRLYKEKRIYQWTELTDREVMAMLASFHG